MPRATTNPKPTNTADSNPTRFPFLRLPAELRNRIYAYSLPKRHFSLSWVGQNPKLKCLTSDKRLLTRHIPEYVIHNIETAHRANHQSEQFRAVIDETHREQRNAVALLRVCRQLSLEAATYFYGNSSFQFHCVKTVRLFLANLRPDTRLALRSLCLQHSIYGFPSQVEHRCIKSKADRCWTAFLWTLTHECPNLIHLTLDLNLNKTPLRFCPLELAHQGFHTEWVQSLWPIEAMALSSFRLRLSSSVVRNSVLEKEARKLRQEILGEAWKEEAQREMDGFGFDRNDLSVSVMKGKQGGLVMDLCTVVDALGI